MSLTTLDLFGRKKKKKKKTKPSEDCYFRLGGPCTDANGNDFYYDQYCCPGKGCVPSGCPDSDLPNFAPIDEMG